MENLARYVARASFSQKRVTCNAEESKAIYHSRDGKAEKVFDALEWLAAMCSHVPNKREQIGSYYGYHSNVARWETEAAGWVGYDYMQFGSLIQLP